MSMQVINFKKLIQKYHGKVLLLRKDTKRIYFGMPIQFVQNKSIK